MKKVTKVKLYWMSNKAVADLSSSIEDNLDRYRNGDFSDLQQSEDWQLSTLLEFELAPLKTLGGTSKDELEDCVTLYEQLRSLPPRLATQMNVWVPLIHTHLLEFTRKRWLPTSGSDEELKKAVLDHVFKSGRTGYRDDNAAGRLWWTAHIAARSVGTGSADDWRDFLRPMMTTTDTRSNFVERPGIFMERGLAKHISEYLAQGHLKDSEKEEVFRGFMRSISRKSNGRYFGDLNQTEVFNFLHTCQP